MRAFVAVLLLGIACRDPFDLGYNDPVFPDPPGPPTIRYPHDGQRMSYQYPDTINLTWSSIEDADAYDVDLCLDSAMTRFYVQARGKPDTSLRFITRAIGWHYWRVRAKSRFWNRGYTDWCPIARFLKPSPAVY